jgi:hypothetical protein
MATFARQSDLFASVPIGTYNSSRKSVRLRGFNKGFIRDSSRSMIGARLKVPPDSGPQEYWTILNANGESVKTSPISPCSDVFSSVDRMLSSQSAHIVNDQWFTLRCFLGKPDVRAVQAMRLRGQICRAVTVTTVARTRYSNQSLETAVFLVIAESPEKVNPSRR